MMKIYIAVSNKAKELISNRKAADMFEWIAIIALVVGAVLFITPTTRTQISSLFSNVFSNLSKISVGD
ncbi:hypothetical protein [Mahella australiensis]|uniref:Uncharacterized protein n=1 Tax=Mahella australiensis (strain DSM 15567 / CIP 107919 / 50-1 BON) TaxID=697281 RepID=F3ZWU5_MAHA5|nr:hypothetical protein [Mahella australiensis]AEE97567.1 hypothetical protein Mahau_2403 [Mahella australiensis 50-1 BON]